MQRRVASRDFSIISNDCWGGMAYEELAARYQSPFVGLFIVPEDYIVLLRNLRSLVEGPLEFRARSKREEINRWRDDIQRQYPIGVLGGDVEVHFLHYPTQEQAAAKWTRRAARINWDKLRVKMSWHDTPGIEGWLREFDALPLGAKVFLAPRTLAGTSRGIYLNDFSTDGTQQYWRAHKAFDVAAFLEWGDIRRVTWTRALDWLLYWHY